MPKGRYLNDSNYFVGIMPNGEVRYYCSEGDYLEEYQEIIEEMKKSEEEES